MLISGNFDEQSEHTYELSGTAFFAVSSFDANASWIL